MDNCVSDEGAASSSGQSHGVRSVQVDDVEVVSAADNSIGISCDQESGSGHRQSNPGTRSALDDSSSNLAGRQGGRRVGSGGGHVPHCKSAIDVGQPLSEGEIRGIRSSENIASGFCQPVVRYFLCFSSKTENEKLFKFAWRFFFVSR